MTSPKPPKVPNLVLRAWRITQGMTRQQMADAVNDTPAAQDGRLVCTAKLIAKWESGETGWPSAGYRDALHQLTGRQPDALGFTAPAPAPRHPPAYSATPAAGPASSAGRQPDNADLRAIDDLAALAALLHARGYTTHVAFSLPALIVSHPDGGDPLHITASGPAFCWEGTAVCPRPPATTLAAAAEVIDLAWPPARPQDNPR
jgi:transcriptional regulator with XRE-family HTH domain